MTFEQVPTQWRERDCLAPLTIVTAAQLMFWLCLYALGFSPMLDPGVYSVFALSALFILVASVTLGFVATMLLRGEQAPIPKLIARAKIYRWRVASAVIATLIIAIGGSAFVNAKSALLRVMAPSADAPLAALDRVIFGTDAWEIFIHAPFLSVIDWLYLAWVAVQALAIFCLTLLPPSRLKAQALTSNVLCWLILGTFLAYLMPSVGPIYFERVIGEGFGELPIVLQGTHALAVAEHLWQIRESGAAGLGAGISAMPSMHVGMTLWLALFLRRTQFAWLAWLAWVYLLIIYVGSVALGWHYASDGPVAVIGVALLWKLSGRLVDARVGHGSKRLRVRPVFRSAAMSIPDTAQTAP